MNAFVRISKSKQLSSQVKEEGPERWTKVVKPGTPS